MVTKKFYWLKLKDIFFKQLAIKKMRKIAGGDTYVIIYLKMMLLSMNEQGKIAYECGYAEFVENLALDLDEQEDNVQMTLAFLKAQKLIEFSGETEAFLPEVPTCIGSECDSAARVRKHREIQKALQSNTDVTLMSQVGNQNVTTEIRDKRKDIDISSSSIESKLVVEDDDDGFNLFREVERKLMITISPYIAEQFRALLDEVGEGVMREALEESAKHGGRSYSYVETTARSIANGRKSKAKIDPEVDARFYGISKGNIRDLTDKERKIINALGAYEFRHMLEADVEKWHKRYIEKWIELGD